MNNEDEVMLFAKIQRAINNTVNYTRKLYDILNEDSIGCGVAPFGLL